MALIQSPKATLNDKCLVNGPFYFYFNLTLAGQEILLLRNGTLARCTFNIVISFRTY